MADPLVRTIPVVLVTDPALSLTPSERKRYGETRDPQMIRELPGQHAVRFMCRPLSSADVGAVESMTSPLRQIVLSFVFGVVEIQDSDELGPRHGARVVPTQKIGGRDAPVWSDEQLDAIQDTYGRIAVYEIGTVVYERTLRGKAAGGSVPYTVPQLSLDELTRMEALLRAAQTTDEPAAT